MLFQTLFTLKSFKEKSFFNKLLGQLLGSPAQPTVAKATKKKGGMSAAGRARIAAAAKARWAKVRAAKK